MKYETIESLIRVFRRTKTTYVGLFLILVAINPPLLTFLSGFVRPALEATKILESALDFKIFYSAEVVAFLLLNALVLIAWLRWRKVPSFKITGAGILFAPHSNSECTDLVEALYEGFCRDLNARDLQRQVSHALLPPHRVIKNAADAQSLLQQSGAQVVIHGVVDKGEIDDQTHEGFTSISFTVRSRPLEANEVQPIFDALAELQFRFHRANNLLGKTVVAENFGDASCFFVALALTLQGRYLSARGVWEGLRRKLQTTLRGKTALQNMTRLSQTWWELNELLYCRQRVTCEVLPEITRAVVHSVANECRRILAVLRRVNPKEPNSVLLDAILDFHFGDIRKARRTVEEAVELTNQQDPAPYFSLAFLALWQGKGKVALRHYRKAQRLGPTTPMVLGVLQFLERVAVVHKRYAPSSVCPRNRERFLLRSRTC